MALFGVPKILFPIFLVAVFSALNPASGQLIPLNKLKGAYTDSVNNSGLHIPSLHARLDSANRLYINDSLWFEPKGHFLYPAFELAGKDHILITAIDSVQYLNSAIFALPKKSVKLLRLGENPASWDLDFESRKFVALKKNAIEVKNKKGQREYILLIKIKKLPTVQQNRVKRT